MLCKRRRVRRLDSMRTGLWLPSFLCLAAACTHAARQETGVASRSSATYTSSCAADTLFFSGTPLAGREGWYGVQLRALGEQRLCFAESQDAEAYRFVLIPTYAPTIAVRLERLGTEYRLRASMLSGAGGYDHGTLARDTTFRLSQSDWSQLRELVAAADFWDTPTHDPPNLLGLDGVQWIVEGWRDGHYHVVDRWSPRPEGPYARHYELGAWMLKRSGLVGR